VFFSFPAHAITTFFSAPLLLYTDPSHPFISRPYWASPAIPMDGSSVLTSMAPPVALPHSPLGKPFLHFFFLLVFCRQTMWSLTRTSSPSTPSSRLLFLPRFMSALASFFFPRPPGTQREERHVPSVSYQFRPPILFCSKKSSSHSSGIIIFFPPLSFAVRHIDFPPAGLQPLFGVLTKPIPPTHFFALPVVLLWGNLSCPGLTFFFCFCVHFSPLFSLDPICSRFAKIYLFYLSLFAPLVPRWLLSFYSTRCRGEVLLALYFRGASSYSEVSITPCVLNVPPLFLIISCCGEFFFRTSLTFPPPPCSCKTLVIIFGRKVFPAPILWALVLCFFLFFTPRLIY